MTTDEIRADPDCDSHVVGEIMASLNQTPPQSFFLYAGAGAGKTKTLVDVLKQLKADRWRAMRIHGRQIAVITYTNAACDEIVHRLEHDPLIDVRTIHSFVWTLIQGFNSDIRTWLASHLQEKLAELVDRQSRGRGTSQASVDRANAIIATHERLAALEQIKVFTYSPTGDNQERDALSHPEVIGLAAAFLQQKPLMRRLLVSRYPVLLIDESQDTNKQLIDSLLETQKQHADRFAIGLIGDMMQRIYTDGKPDLVDAIPSNWSTPRMVMNHRSPERIVRLINRIRSDADGQQQKCREDAAEGLVRLFVCSAVVGDTSSIENAVRRKMANLTGDALWTEFGKVKGLLLEHLMAARRLGFVDLFQPLYDSEHRAALLRGDLPALQFFCEIVLPLVDAGVAGNQFRIASILRQHSPLLGEARLRAEGFDQRESLKSARTALTQLLDLWGDNADPSLSQVLELISRNSLLLAPSSLIPFTTCGPLKSDDSKIEDDGPNSNDAVTSIRTFLAAPFSQLRRYVGYMADTSIFDTHQGVKGREFDRVMVVTNDVEARGFSFNYDKLFGAAPPPKSRRQASESKEPAEALTRRLLYVTCSRSMGSLAVLVYSQNPEAVRANLIKWEWFASSEVETLVSA